MRLLLHICCAPDATVPVLDLMAGDGGQDATAGAGGRAWDVTGFFYGSNIQPKEEYLRRLGALHTLMERAGISVIEAPYAPGSWTERMTGLGLMGEPEGGRRCTECFRLQLDAAAEKATRLGCACLCTTLTISPHKDVERINRIGAEEAARRGLIWENRVWRKQNGFLRSIRLSREWGLYRQNYCGCLPSLSRAKTL